MPIYQSIGVINQQTDSSRVHPSRLMQGSASLASLNAKQETDTHKLIDKKLTGVMTDESSTNMNPFRSFYSLTLASIMLVYWATLASTQKAHVSQTLSSMHDAQAARNLSADQFELNTDWLMMASNGERTEDLMASEARGSASISELGSARNSSIKRSGYKRKSHKNSNRTMYDDEQSESSDSNEIFDDSDEIAGSAKEPECAAHNRYYCTYKENYPLKLVTEVTKYYRWPLEKLFRDLHAQIMPKLAQDTNGNLVCDSVTRVVRPGWARNTNDRWLVVINTENYHQYVTEVVCLYGSNSRCNFVPPCYYSSCQQRYNTQKLLVIDPMNPYRGPFLSEFLFPSCCVCYVPSTSDSLQDKLRPSPATMYQRTMQQEAATNLNPVAGYRPLSLINDDAQASGIDQQSGSDVQRQARYPAGSASLASQGQLASSISSRHSQDSPISQPAAPGEIRRAGDLYRLRDSLNGVDDPRSSSSSVLNSDEVKSK